MRFTQRLMVAFVAVLAGGCGSGGDGDADPVGDPARVAEWTIGDQPLFVIGDLDGPEAIGRLITGHPDVAPSRAVLLPGGRVAMADASSSEIRIYDETGSRFATLGRRGPGPGEFRALSGIAVLAGGDSIGAWESSTTRRGRIVVTRFATDGSPEAMVVTLDSGGFDEIIGVHDDGSVLIMETTATLLLRRDYDGIGRDTFEVRRISRDGEVTTVRGSFLGPELVFARPGRIAPFLRMRTTAMAVGADRFYAGDTDVFSVETFEIDSATPRHRFTRDVESRRIPAPELDRLREASESVASATGTEDLIVPFPETYPAFTKIIPDADGNIWVMEGWVPEGENVRASIFDRSGALIAELIVPQGLGVESIGGDRILVSSYDDLQVARLSVYPLLK